jgi:hypothetical protein
LPVSGTTDQINKERFGIARKELAQRYAIISEMALLDLQNQKNS